MAKPLYIPVKETDKELKQRLRSAKPFLRPRLIMLLVMRREGEKGVSKQVLMALVGVCGQSINSWRKAYRAGGIEQLLSHQKKGFKPSVFAEEEKRALQALVENPHNGIVGYKELQGWVLQNFGKEVKYITLNKFMKAHFNTKIKVARKSHVKKDPQQAEAFKKTSVPSAKARYKALITRSLAASTCTLKTNPASVCLRGQVNR